jgi:hypothetical protein
MRKKIEQDGHQGEEQKEMQKKMTTGTAIPKASAKSNGDG